jgi:hypothetical protein
MAPEKTPAALPAHKKFIDSLEQVSPHFKTLVANAKKMGMPPGTKAAMQNYPRIVAWLEQHGEAYEGVIASMKPKAARAAG